MYSKIVQLARLYHLFQHENGKVFTNVESQMQKSNVDFKYGISFTKRESRIAIHQLKVVPGEFEITKSDALALAVNGYEGTYDGKEHTGTASATINNEPATDAKIVYLVHYSEDVEGMSEMPTIKDVIRNDNGEVGSMVITVRVSLTNYKTVEKEMVLKVNPIAIVLTAASDSKTADGSALTNNNYSITSGAFTGDEGFDTVTVSGSQTTVGHSANTIAYTLKSNTLAGNYDITTVDGTLTVNEASNNNNNDNNGGTTIDDAATPLASVPAVLGARREPAAVPTENGTTDNSKGVLGAKRGAATGDDSPIAPWAAALVLSLGLGGIMITDHKKRRNK